MPMWPMANGQPVYIIERIDSNLNYQWNYAHTYHNGWWENDKNLVIVGWGNRGQELLYLRWANNRNFRIHYMPHNW